MKLPFLLAALCFGLCLYGQDLVDVKQWIKASKYRENNEMLHQQNKTNARVVFMGNSITEGWSVADRIFFQSNGYVNRGISGQTTAQMLLRFQADVIDLKPAAVVLLAGINDIAENAGPFDIHFTLGQIKSMVEIAQANRIRVILCAILPANHFYWRPTVKPAEQVIALNKLLQSLAKAKQIPFVDFYSPLVDEQQGLRKEYGSDGVHPSSDGYNQMKQIIQPIIQRTIKIQSKSSNKPHTKTKK